MGRYVLSFHEIDQTHRPLVGGKGAHLGELSRIADLRVPAGFCITTDAVQRVMSGVTSIDEQLEQLSHLESDDWEQIALLSAELRRTIEAAPIPADVAAAITDALTAFDLQTAFAIRSSATSEDSPTTSFAGQHDSYLDISGTAAILRHVSRCWASLFTERAVIYRLRNRIDHRKVRMAVVVQQMVFAEVSGILFTADPLTGNRKISSIEATFGLGEALVSGVVNADVYKVRADQVVSTSITTDQPALTDAEVLRLATLGRRIQSHFGRPQDIEWCFVDDVFYIVQARPITTLFPIPAADDGKNHVYLSVGHQQMMTDAMKPLGLSVWQLTAARPMDVAGGRLFVDVTQQLASPSARSGLLDIAGKSDPLIRDALQTILDRGDFIASLPADSATRSPAGASPPPLETDPAIVTELIARNEASIAALKRAIVTKSGVALIDFILADITELKRILFDPQSHLAIMAGMEATWWLNEKLYEWLGEKNVADTLTQSVPNNVTSEMGLALLDVADVIRPHRDVVAFLQNTNDDNFLDELSELRGGREAHDAILHWLGKYGVRGPGEIDITRPRWIEQPATLLPLIMGNVRNFEPGVGKQRFEQGEQESERKERELLAQLRTQPDGDQKAAETKRMIDRVRTFAGYREYPKYGMVSRYFVYKQALLREAARLVQENVLQEPEDIFYLTLQELHDVARTKHVDNDLIRDRKQAFTSYQALTPPRVLTSDGEMLNGAYRRDDIPEGALVGLAVSAGSVEGRARIILDMANANLEPGDILVTPFTDPSWTPLFVAIKGLVTEVGGLMTHGAVIAREYGLPAVVGVERATQRIRDGQRIRVHGTEGYVEIL